MWNPFRSYLESMKIKDGPQKPPKPFSGVGRGGSGHSRGRVGQARNKAIKRARRRMMAKRSRRINRT